jgi:hypothetical protein
VDRAWGGPARRSVSGPVVVLVFMVLADLAVQF